ncbi:reticulon-4-interacting protein 1 homolog, mitochondrial [Sipha flava]|uniref:Reticulon-4-interacting protein 1 homolog, mitochondrial n=1 Tax=Sipha flava TaxID=143950 RepID=A0A8B8F8H2_9HEMI|nr:reticulon-4-interacting protein 1 homolog, mitochondrial [Sipha flava]XP_025407139.1 reticulon-4-interacting protein 1 homolog, mitochondrial [Sipha flava]XP_025407140.1 reticulon-4-interacting protein 1 homolog, mitochondrial [Sipha flava]XP_025407141.1 reticulon-4-interacting protein 1 homolog, mitochondrial [Sipha flava]
MSETANGPAARMVAWQVDSYGPFENSAKLNADVGSPAATVGPKDVLVRVRASSVNPIDVLMAEGYGQVLLGRIRQAKNMSLCRPVEFPLTLGRDFSGEVVATGIDVPAVDFTVGDSVMGVVAPYQQGCHAELVVAPAAQVIKKPKHMSDEEASSLLYTGLTAWCALKVSGGLYVLNASGKNVLVLGGSGGVGNCAIQILKSWGAKVTTTCSTNAINLVKGLGPDNVIDYTTEDAHKQIEQFGKYDLILDAAGIPYDSINKYMPLLKCWSFSGFITLRSPILHNTDSYGMIAGMLKNAYDLVVPNIVSGAVFKGSSIRWGTFMPLESGIKELAQLAEEKKLVVPIDSVFEFADMKDAFKKVKNGHIRGKVVVTFNDTKINTKN